MPSSSNRKLPGTDFEDEARKAAIDVEDLFESKSELLNDNLAGMVALFDPEEVILGDVMKSAPEFSVAALNGISLRYDRDPPFDYEMEDARDRFADRSHDPFYAVKSISPESIRKDKQSAAAAGAGFMLEVKILMNLEKHPHICQVYGLSASGPMASFGSELLEDNFFLITDAIAETLPERLKSWREKKCYEGERFDDLASRQSRFTQRLEVALEISSAMTFLANRKLVYFLHPEKVGFDVRYGRIKLSQFGTARESGKKAYYTFEEEDMGKRVYLAPEVFQNDPVTVSADVFALGMLIWEILTLARPLDGMTKEMHLRDVVEGRIRPQLNRSWPNDLRHLMEECWASSNRPTMKQAYDRLEGCLLFQDFNGIDKTENHSRNLVDKPKNRMIRYQRNATETITEEERDKDARSTRSRESAKSKESSKSRKSNGSNDQEKKQSKSRNKNSQKSSSSRHSTESDHKSVGESDKKLRRSRRKSFSADPDHQDKPSSSRHRRQADGEEKSSRSTRRIEPEFSVEGELPLNNSSQGSDERRRKLKDKDRRKSSRDVGSNSDNESKSSRSRSRSRDARLRKGSSTRDVSRSSSQKPSRRKSHDPALKEDSNSGIQAILDAAAKASDHASRSTTEDNNTASKSNGRQRSPRRRDESRERSRRSRSKSGDRQKKRGDSVSHQTSSRRMISSRDVSSRKLGRSKSDETGGSIKTGREHSSRKLSRNKSSDGADIARYSPDRSPGSLRSRPCYAENASPHSLKRSAREPPLRKLVRTKSGADHPGNEREAPVKRGLQRTHSTDSHLIASSLARKGLQKPQAGLKQSQSSRSLLQGKEEVKNTLNIEQILGKDAGDEPDRRVKPASNGGLLKPASKDTTKGSRSRLQKEKSAHDVADADTSMAARARQRREEYTKSVTAAAHIGQKDVMKRRKSTKKSLGHDTTLLKEVFVED